MPQPANFPLPLGHAGASSLLLALGKVADSRLSSIGLAPSPRRPLVIAEHLSSRRSTHDDRGQPTYSRTRGQWTVNVEVCERLDWGVVTVSHLGNSGRWCPQDAPDGAPASSFVGRGVDPLARHNSYHYLRRSLHQTMGQRWDPSPSSPAEVAFRADGSIDWSRRFVGDCPTDRAPSRPALQVFWPSGNVRMIRRSSAGPDIAASPVYAEFYPDGTPAVEVFSGSLIRAHFPDGRLVERKDFSSPAESSCARIWAFSTQLDFDASSAEPNSSFIDQFPDGAWRLHRCLHPDEVTPLPRASAWTTPPTVRRQTRSPVLLK